jgi:hypothetical protein
VPTRIVLLAAAVFSVAWALAAGIYFVGDLRTELAIQRHLARIEEAHAFVIPAPCAQARRLEATEFRREEARPETCWISLRGFRRLYPDVAAATDLAATVHFNAPAELPVEGQGGPPAEALFRAVAGIVTGPALVILLALSWA